MNISGCIFQKRFIELSTEHEFEATYKGRQFYISTDHGFGQPDEEHLKRFNIEVTDIQSGMKDCDTWEDYESIEKAIHHALEGACLLPSQEIEIQS